MSKKANSPDVTIQDQITKLKPIVQLLELRAKRLSLMNELGMLDTETAVDILATIEQEMKKKSPQGIADFAQVRDKCVFEWKVDPEKYKLLVKRYEDAEQKQKPSIEIVPSANKEE